MYSVLRSHVSMLSITENSSKLSLALEKARYKKRNVLEICAIHDIYRHSHKMG